MSPLALPCLAALCAGAASTSPAAATPVELQPPSYVVRGAGNATADGVYVQRSKGSGASYVAASGMQAELDAIAALVLAYFGFRRGTPYLPGAPLRSAFGEQRWTEPVAKLADGIAVLAIAFGVAGSGMAAALGMPCFGSSVTS